MVSTYKCQGLLPSGFRCGRYVEFEDDGLCLCKTCHNKHSRSIGKRMEEKIKYENLVIS